jgi:predicted transcriptional regulator
MKTYQIDIEDSLFPELKRALSSLPKESVKLYNKSGYEIHIDSNDIELSAELMAALDEGIAELDRGEGIPHEQVIAEMQAKYLDLTFKK